MAEPNLPSSVGGEPPLPPEHSLPSYHEPTPETHRRMSREEEAELALTRTEGSRAAMWLVTIGFLLTIVALPVINLAARLRREPHSHGRPGAEVLALFPTAAELKQAHGWRGWVGLLPTAEEIKAAEKNLEKESIVTQYLLPRVQTVLTGTLGAGNEQVYPGRDGWLFYRPDVDYVIGPPFLDPERLKHRARDLGIQPDPVKAIVNFNEQLKARGIKLIVVPVPPKPSMAIDRFSKGARMKQLTYDFSGKGRRPISTMNQPLEMTSIDNLSFPALERELEARDIATIQVPQVSNWPASYLTTDTHWEPSTMWRAAHVITQELAKISPDFREVGWYGELHARSGRYSAVDVEVAGMGDIVGLLKLPRAQTLFPRQTVTLKQVQENNALWKPTRESDILLLGDSFSNIYSLAAMGWGESAGFAEHISFNLQRPLDCIIQNSDGAFATREALSREMARGRDRLAGKKVVIWEFAERELMFGNWKLLSMALGEPKPAKLYSEAPAEGVVVTATVSAMSFIPRPGTVPYKEHIFSVHLQDIEGTGQPGNVQAVAYLWSMRENVWTAAARWRPGDRVKLRLTPWPGGHPEREKLNISVFTDAELSLAEQVWADVE